MNNFTSHETIHDPSEEGKWGYNPAYGMSYLVWIHNLAAGEGKGGFDIAAAALPDACSANVFGATHADP